jgi:hypothetical protein
VAKQYITERIYSKGFASKGRNDVIKWEVQRISDGQFIKVTFLSSNSPFRQGIALSTDKGIEVNGQIYPGVQLWEDTAPKQLICKCFTDNGLLSIYNLWDNGNGSDSQSFTSGMLLEEHGNILIYHCNDIGFETNFDKLIFSIEL